MFYFLHFSIEYHVNIKINVRFCLDTDLMELFEFEILLHISGCVMFVCGMTINIHSDHILRNLRKPGETGYKIPKGNIVSSLLKSVYDLDI